jgi:hypothetical protein
VLEDSPSPQKFKKLLSLSKAQENMRHIYAPVAVNLLIPRTPFAITIEDSLLEGAGGFSVTLGF